MESGKSLTFHRGPKTGPIIARTECCQEKRGSSKIHIVESSTEILLEHVPRRFIVLPPKTTFSADGIKYFWTGSTELYRDDTSTMVAQYHSTLIKNNTQKIGQLLVRWADSHFLDVAVISSFLLQQRPDLCKGQVSCL